MLIRQRKCWKRHSNGDQPLNLRKFDGYVGFDIHMFSSAHKSQKLILIIVQLKITIYNDFVARMKLQLKVRRGRCTEQIFMIVMEGLFLY